MKRISILCVLVLFFQTVINAGSTNKNSFTIGIDGFIGQFDSDNKTAGVLAHGGYDFFFNRINFLSIEPKIGVGYFGRPQAEGLNPTLSSGYNIACFAACISPKLHLSLNPDDTALIFIENEFSLLNAHARIEDQGQSNTRVSRGLLFYYTLKLGLTFKLSDNNKLAIWVGGSTLNFDTLLNNHIPKGQKRYSGESSPFAIGVNFHL